MIPLAARFGVTPARSRQCLTDSKGVQRLLDMTKAANDAGVDHTPTFIINGKVSSAATWEQLEPELKKALGG
jgi:protein-disulfide isomerase